jgi:hypothetical protein
MVDADARVRPAASSTTCTKHVTGRTRDDEARALLRCRRSSCEGGCGGANALPSWSSQP